jgi:hypothetical protein
MEETLAAWGRTGTPSLTEGEGFVRRDDFHALPKRIDESGHLAYCDILTNGSLIR